MRFYFRSRVVDGCTGNNLDVCAPGDKYWAATELVGDTLITRFEPRRQFDAPRRRRETAAGNLRMRIAGRAHAARWAALNPRDLLGHFYYGFFLNLTGDLEGARRELAAAAEIGQT